jgi:hypothetical protein
MNPPYSISAGSSEWSSPDLGCESALALRESSFERTRTFLRQAPLDRTLPPGSRAKKFACDVERQLVVKLFSRSPVSFRARDYIAFSLDES